MRSLLAAALVAAAASTASAGPYLGLGIGTSASPSGDFPMSSSDGSRTGRLVVGTQFGRFSIEGQGSKYGFYRSTLPYSGSFLAVAGKYSLPLGDNFEAFGRLGLERTWLSTDVNAPDFTGNGFLIGAGFEYRFTVSGVGASAFVDYQRTQSSLLNQNDMKTTKDVGIGMWTLGATVSL
jgi:hypothetical protein